MRILLILIFLCSTANAALTPNKLPKTKTGGSSPTLQDSQILDDGTNVGISTVNPVALLEVTQTAALDAFRVNDQASDTTPFIIDSVGNVGIGTTRASGSLSVVSQTGASFINVASNASTNDAALFLSYRGDQNNMSMVYNDALAELRFRVADQPDVFNMKKVAAQNVVNIGIGTFEPNALLDISSTAAQDLFRVNDNGSGDTTPFIIDSVGNVGIGTTLPNALLDIGQRKFRVDSNGKLRLAGNISTSTATAQIDFSNSVGFTSASTVLGLSGEVSNSSTGNVIGYQTTSASSATGTVNEMRGVSASIRTLAAGTSVTSGFNFYATSPTITAGTIGTQYGMYIADQEPAGVTTGYGVYQVTSDNDNYFAGNVGIGSVTPSSILDIDIGTGVGQVTINGSTGGCLMIRDTDDAGWTECDVLDGVMTCSIDADGICD